MSQSARLHSLDNLRAILMWLGIVLHVAVNHFAGEFPLPWRDPETSQVANLIFAFIHSFRMPAFFLIAGFFAAMLVAQRGYLGMLKHRALRIGVPFAIFWPLLYVAMMYLIGRYLTLMAQSASGIEAAIAPSELDRPIISTLHLWFIYYLFWFCVAAAILGYAARFVPQPIKAISAAIAQRLSAHWCWIPVWTAPMVVAGLSYPNGLVQTSGNFLPRLPEVTQYGLYFLFGWLLFRHREPLLDQYARHCWRYAGAGLLAFVVSLSLFDALRANPAQASHIKLGIGIAYNLVGWLWSLALIGLFLRYVPRQNRLLAYIADSAYWVYLVHMVATLGFGLLLFNADMSALSKIAVNIIATTAVCLASYHLLVRYTVISTLLNGRRHIYTGFFTPIRLGVTAAALFVCFLAVSQIKWSKNVTPTLAGAPEQVAVAPDVAAFLKALGEAYGSADSAEVERHLASDFLYQGMDRTAFLRHLSLHQRHLGKLEIVPVAAQARDDALRVTAYAVAPQGVLGPPLQLLPLNAGATLIKETGSWKLRGNQRRSELGLFKQGQMLVADFAAADLDAYRRHVPPGYDMPRAPYVRLAVANWVEMEPPQSPYRMTQLSVLVSKEGLDYWHVVAMPETEWVAVQTGKAVGFPKSIADIDIQRSLANQWQVALRQEGKLLAEIEFDPVTMTKTNTLSMPANPDDYLVFGRDGTPLKAVMTPLQTERPKASLGWMRVNTLGAPWQDLIAPGSKAVAAAFDLAAPRKLNISPLNEIAVPADIRQMLDQLKKTWAANDLEQIFRYFHPAFQVTNQSDIINMRRLFLVSRSFDWRISAMREEGRLVYLKGEVKTDVGSVPLATRLIKEGDRWLFYGDGGSRMDKEIGDLAVPSGQESFEDVTRREALQAQAGKDDLPFTIASAAPGPFTSIGNVVFQPQGRGPFPALVLLHGCGGIYERGMRHWITAAIGNGYAVVAVDSMRGHATNCPVPLKVSIARRIKDAIDAREYLGNLGSIDAKRIAVAGFSQGGVVALLLASPEFSGMYAPRERFAAAAAVYPLCYLSARYAPFDADLLRADTDIPLLALMGGEDTFTPSYDCLFNLQKLQARGAPVDWQVFPGATHGWDIPEISGGRTRSFRGDLVAFSYHPGIAAASRQATFDFLAKRMPAH